MPPKKRNVANKANGEKAYMFRRLERPEQPKQPELSRRTQCVARVACFSHACFAHACASLTDQRARAIHLDAG